MHIDEILLENFKSFGRTTRIPFYEDFTTISGPNGSGKSNIIDAVLFALGLARTRGIRAKKLTDLIYTPGHADTDEAHEDAPAEAAVEVVLDNTDRTLQRSQVVNAAGTDSIGDVDTIEVRRRVKRTDADYYSYYYLNGRSVNLSDIQDLLAQAGVAPEGYNVVMQGDVTGIINMTPLERRRILDEIAGVAEFDAKKAEAEEELDVVAERISDAELRIDEKEARLERLEDEREEALAYQELREEKAEYEGYVKAAELADKRATLDDIQDEINAAEDELEEELEELDSRVGEVTRLESELEELNQEIERTGEDEQLRIKSEMEEIKAEISTATDRIEAAEERITEAEADRRSAFVEIDRKQETIEEIEEDIRETKVEKASLLQDIEAREEDLADVEAEIEAVDTEYDELKTALEEAKAELEEQKDERNELQREQDRLIDEARRRSSEIESVEADLEEVRARIPELKRELDDLEEELEKAQRNRENIDAVVEELKDERTALKSELDEVEDELTGAQEEYARLEASAAEDGDSSFGRAVQAVLESDLDGIHGAVAQLGGVSEEYATACETAAGARLANIVVDDDEVGQRAIEHLKRRNAGRATMLPLTEMDRRATGSLPDHDGVVDFAVNLVEYDEEYAGVFSYVFGSTLVVDDMDTARDLMGSYRMVTLDGDLVETSGAMTGGSGSGSRYSFSNAAGQLERVASRISDLEERRRSLKEEIREVESRLDDARDRQAEAADQVRTIESDLEDREDALAEAEEEIADLEERISELEAEREEVDERSQELEEEINAADEAIAETQSDIEELQSELADSRIPELTDRKESIQADIREMENRVDDLDAELNDLGLQKEYAEDAIEDLHEDVESAQERKADAQERISELEDEVADAEARLEEKREQVAELESELADLKAEREALNEDLSDARTAREVQQATVDRVESRLESLRSRASELEAEIDTLQEEATTDPDDVPDLDEVEARIAELDDEMEALEPVNMLAIDEYEEVQEDLADLQEKRETLVEEREAITERIESYERQKRQTFMESFNAIDEHFQDVFERLSDGTGELHLENEEDPFEGGLTMKAEPGDKPVQRLDAMSGGEKSLTALSFIFAIQRHNPAPFYALDEVDAFLDAANADRVGEMVDDLAGDAQFIVVSHRSAMLERSEHAIGVTMREDNISAVTGIDLSTDEQEDPERGAADD